MKTTVFVQSLSRGYTYELEYDRRKKVFKLIDTTDDEIRRAGIRGFEDTEDVLIRQLEDSAYMIRRYEKRILLFPTIVERMYCFGYFTLVGMDGGRLGYVTIVRRGVRQVLARYVPEYGRNGAFITFEDIDGTILETITPDLRGRYVPEIRGHYVVLHVIGGDHAELPSRTVYVPHESFSKIYEYAKARYERGGISHLVVLGTISPMRLHDGTPIVTPDGAVCAYFAPAGINASEYYALLRDGATVLGALAERIQLDRARVEEFLKYLTLGAKTWRKIAERLVFAISKIQEELRETMHKPAITYLLADLEAIKAALEEEPRRAAEALLAVLRRAPYAYPMGIPSVIPPAAPGAPRKPAETK